MASSGSPSSFGLLAASASSGLTSQTENGGFNAGGAWWTNIDFCNAP